jgi:BirA family biotin operon repressor/biotin-[acetyl-CoA-carboxylase] ligase
VSRFADIRHFSEIDSTNRYLIDEARAGAAEGVVAVAQVQTAGRGRLGRTWTAPPGSSLLVSILLRPALDLSQAHLVTMAAGLAACEAVFTAADFAPSLKWPNDLIVGGRKLAGMLSEAEVSDGHVDALVVGVGVNVNWRDFPEEIAATATACNIEAGRPVDQDALLMALLERFDAHYDALLAPLGVNAVLDQYRARCATLGRDVRVELAGETFTGTALDVTVEGHLTVRTDAGVREVSAGDVVHLR